MLGKIVQLCQVFVSLYFPLLFKEINGCLFWLFASFKFNSSDYNRIEMFLFCLLYIGSNFVSIGTSNISNISQLWHYGRPTRLKLMTRDTRNPTLTLKRRRTVVSRGVRESCGATAAQRKKNLSRALTYILQALDS